MHRCELRNQRKLIARLAELERKYQEICHKIAVLKAINK
jgi:hypothetical protein